jgi:hypothetical protein
MARLMAFQLTRHRARDPRWVEAREGERVSHNQLMSALEEAVWFMCQGYHYIESSEAIFLGLYNRSSQDIKDELGIGHVYQIELYQSKYALKYQGIAKDIASERLDERSELSFEEAKDIIYTAASLIAPQILATSKILGRDVATDLPLLADKID